MGTETLIHKQRSVLRDIKRIQITMIMQCAFLEIEGVASLLHGQMTPHIYQWIQSTPCEVTECADWLKKYERDIGKKSSFANQTDPLT